MSRFTLAEAKQLRSWCDEQEAVYESLDGLQDTPLIRRGRQTVRLVRACLAVAGGTSLSCPLDHMATAAQLKRVLAGPGRFNNSDRELVLMVVTMLEATSHESPSQVYE